MSCSQGIESSRHSNIMEISSHHTTPSNLSLRLTPKESNFYARPRHSKLRFFFPALPASAKFGNPLGFLTRNSLVFVLTMVSILLTIQDSHAQISLVTGSPQSATTTTATLTIAKPSGLAVGDVMIANIVQSDNDGADGGDLSNATLAGWTLIDGAQTGIAGSGGDEWWGTVLYKVASAADVSAANFAFTLDSEADDSE